MVEQRLKLKISLTLEFTAILSGHGKTKSYLHSFQFIDNPMCPCNGGAQSSEHLKHDCEIVDIPSETMKNQIQASGGTWPTTWPTTNRDLIAKYLQAFVRFIKSIDFNKLQYIIVAITEKKINTKLHLGGQVIYF
jgi:hypothetical protein